ncbi:aldose 1-epimerase [Paenibacillus sp. GP183]|uniref:aldose 1-epimerase n=1 Tax=Paenibacillus sp. GP183 TaxID=1882751 RepID=UPI000898655C|nr:aldose 1-epimerase [Paenibacillus sp. GP183]SEC65412.1 aldose 1-epimerase [Paenibacillus sp. GP183]
MIKKEDWQGVQVYTVSNDILSFSLCPSINNNVYSIWDKKLNRELLRVPESPKTLAEARIHYGTPIMMPPNRIRRGKFEYDGRTYQFPINTANENHIHGVIGNLHWKVTDISEEDDSIAITSSLNIQDIPDTFKVYPHPLTLEVTYVLSGSTLTHKLKATNAGNTKAPFGYGLHTWFLLDHEPQNWSFELPVNGIWELDPELIPTGTILPLGRYADLPHGISLQGQNMDTVFQIGSNQRQAVLRKEGFELRYTASEQFKHWVIYTKGETDNYICLEPYTWVTNAPNLDLDPEVTGIIGIEPGQSIDMEVKLELVYT